MDEETIINDINIIKASTEYICQPEVQEAIKELIHNGYSIRQIAKACPNVSIFDIVTSLFREYDNDIMFRTAIDNYYYGLRIDSDRCLVIADTHIGRLKPGEDENSYLSDRHYSNERCLWTAYDYACRNGIKNVIHLGDLIEGNSNPRWSQKLSVDAQLEYLAKVYPPAEECKTYLLYGNHDENIQLHDKKEKDFYKRCRNMEQIGTGLSYMFFCDYIIKLYHDCNMIFKKLDINPEFTLAGHSHSYSFNPYQRYIHVPALSYLEAGYDNIGFVELIHEENEFIFKLLDMNANYRKEDVLTKKRVEM